MNIRGESNLGKVYETKQLCYVAEGVDRMLLSREACGKLGMINEKFPAVGSADDFRSRSIPVAQVNQNPAAALNEEHFDFEPCSPNDDGTCSCPRRESCPPPPKFDPTLSTGGLRKQLIKHYGASAFNRCTRQTLPLMRGKPNSNQSGCQASCCPHTSGHSFTLGGESLQRLDERCGPRGDRTSSH